MYCLQRFTKFQTCEHLLRITGSEKRRETSNEVQCLNLSASWVEEFEEKNGFPEVFSFIKHTLKFTLLSYMNSYFFS